MELNELHEGVDHSLTNDRGIEGRQSPVMEQTIPQIRETAERQRVATAMRMASLAMASRSSSRWRRATSAMPGAGSRAS